MSFETKQKHPQGKNIYDIRPVYVEPNLGRAVTSRQVTPTLKIDCGKPAQQHEIRAEDNCRSVWLDTGV